MRVALAAAFGAVLTGRGHAQPPWADWNACETQRLVEAEEPVVEVEEQEVGLRFASARHLSGQQQPGDDLTREELKDRHQIVFINNVTGKLEVNHNASLWDKLLTLHDEVNMIVTFGTVGAGMSTLASMLACSMNEGDETDTVLFPAEPTLDCNTKGCHLDSDATVGVWATDPFTYAPPNGGPAKYYVIVDTQGIKQSNQLIPGLSTKLYNDAAIKMIALFSEIASEFVYVTDQSRTGVGADEYNYLTSALKSTRENLVRTSEEFISEAEKNVNIRTTNHPGLLWVTRENSAKNLVKGDMSYDVEEWEKNAAFEWNARDADFKQYIGANFKGHNVTINGAVQEIKWNFQPVPNMADSLTKDKQFFWTSEVTNPFPLKKGASCKAYKEMNSYPLGWNCKMTDGGGTENPAAPPTYKVMIDNLAKQIYDHAPAREVLWGEMSTAVSLTGSRLKGFLDAGVTEINKAGPVPDNELWRVIAEDRCIVDLKANLMYYYNGKYDQIKVSSDAVKMNLINYEESEIAQKNTTMIAIWSTATEQFDTLVDNFFLNNALLASVRPSCTADSTHGFDKINLKASRLFKQMALLGATRATLRLEAEVDRLEKDAKRMRDEINSLWWQANLPYLIAMAALGVGVLWVFTRMFGQVCGTCRSCIACCEDLQTSDTEHKVTYVGPGGTELTGNFKAEAPHIPGVAPIAVAMGGADPALNQRIEELEAVVMQLASLIPKSELDAMGLSSKGDDSKV